MPMEIVRKPASASNNGELESSASQVISGPKTFSGAITPSGGIVGKTDGVAVAAGLVGERLSHNPASSIAVAASTTFVNIASIPLTPGVWVVYGTTQTSISSISGWTYFQANISLTTPGFDSNSLGGMCSFIPGSSTSATGSPQNIALPPRIFTVSVNTPVYLIGRLDYSTQTGCTFSTNSRIEAVRIA